MNQPAFPTHWQDEAAGMSLRTYVASRVLPEIVAATSKSKRSANGNRSSRRKEVINLDGSE